MLEPILVPNPEQRHDVKEPSFIGKALSRTWVCFGMPQADRMLVEATLHCFAIARFLVQHEEKRAVIVPFLPFLEAVFEDLLKLEHDCLLVQLGQRDAVEEDLKEVRALYAVLLRKKIDAGKRDLELVSRYLRTIPTEDLDEVARFSVTDPLPVVQARVQEVVEYARGRLEHWERGCERFSANEGTEPFSQELDDQPPYIWTRLSQCVQRFYEAMPQRDAKTFLADPSMADFSLTSPLASQLFLEAIDWTIMECSSLFDPTPRGFTVAAPVVPESAGSWWGIVDAPVVPGSALSDAYVRAAHEVGHWAHIQLNFADTVKEALDTGFLSDPHQHFLVQMMSEVFSDTYAALVAFGPGEIDRGSGILVKMLLKEMAVALSANHSDDNLFALLLRVCCIYLLVRRDRVMRPQKGLPAGIHYFLTRPEMGADAAARAGMDELEELRDEVAAWLTGKAGEQTEGSQTREVLEQLVQFLQTVTDSQWNDDVAPLLLCATRISYLALLDLRFPHLLLLARRWRRFTERRLRTEEQIGKIRDGTPLGEAFTVAELSLYLKGLQDSEEAQGGASMQVIAANLASALA